MSKKIKEASVFTAEGDFVRAYNEKLHGKNYEKLAKDYAKKVGGEVKKTETTVEEEEEEKVLRAYNEELHGKDYAKKVGGEVKKTETTVEEEEEEKDEK